MCLADGLPIPCSTALRLISFGFANVDPRRSDPWSLAQLGIHPSWERIHDQKAAQATYKPGIDADTGEPINVIAISGGDHWELRYTVGIGFGLGGQQSPENQSVPADRFQKCQGQYLANENVNIPQAANMKPVQIKVVYFQRLCGSGLRRYFVIAN